MALDHVIPAGATGVGSMPGTSVAEAVAIIAGELPDLPHVPELPARGPGSDLIGRTAVLLSEVWRDLGLDTTPTGWRLTGSSSAALRRGRSWLGEDLDRCEQVFGDSDGNFKLQMCGPWTFVAAVEAGQGGPALRDAGLVADIVTALAVAAHQHLDSVQRRLPNRQLVLQLDEPLLPAVLSGRIQSASGFTRLPEVPEGDAAAPLKQVVDTVDQPTMLHCCDSFPFSVAAAADFAGVSWDLALTPNPVDPVAAAFEAGQHLVIGAVPTTRPPETNEVNQTTTVWGYVQELWRRTGLSEADLSRVSFSPSCGLARASPHQARAALGTAAELSVRSSR